MSEKYGFKFSFTFFFLARLANFIKWNAFFRKLCSLTIFLSFYHVGLIIIVSISLFAVNFSELKFGCSVFGCLCMILNHVNFFVFREEIVFALKYGAKREWKHVLCAVYSCINSSNNKNSSNNTASPNLLRLPLYPNRHFAPFSLLFRCYDFYCILFI